MKKKIRVKTMMKKIWTCVVLLLLAALLLSGCYVASPSEWLPGRGNPSSLPPYPVSFGAYGGKAIVWYVLGNSGDNLLLVSKYILDTRAYHSTDGATWSESDMRAWLNGDFCDAAFTDLEKSALLGSDKVTLLTLAQAENPDYFGNDNVRIASTGSTNSTYWLTDDGGAAKCVTDTGAIESADATDNYGVRPVISIGISAIAQLIEEGLYMLDGEVESIDGPPTESELALWDDTLPSLSVSGYAVDDKGTLTIDCTASSALAAGEKVYAYFTNRNGYDDYIGCSSLTDGKLTYKEFPAHYTYDAQLAVVKPSSTDSPTWAVGPASTLSGPVHNLNIYGIEEGGSYLTGQSLEFTAVGLYADPANYNYYDRYRPTSWSVGSQSGTFGGSPYTGSIIFSEPGDYTLAVIFDYEYYDDTWVKKSSLTRTVSFHVAEPVSLTASPADGIIRTGESITLTPNVTGGTWDFDSDYLSRSGNVFTGLKEGTATVKYTADGQYDTYTVTIVRVDVTGVTLSSTSETLKKGETTTLTATVSPSDASYSDVTWKSSDESIAAVDASGKVTAKDFGTAAITAEADGKFAICIINVVKTDVTSVTLSSTSETLKKGEATTLTATVSPSDATYSDVTWKSSNTAIVTVDSTGTVTAKGYGSATVTAEADGKFDTCTVTVVKTNVTNVGLSSTSETLAVGDTVVLSATVSPGRATYPGVTWTSTNPSVATVNQSGKVTAVSEGAAAIIADADGVYAVCAVLVASAADSEPGNDTTSTATPAPTDGGGTENVPGTGDDTPTPTVTPNTVIIKIVVSGLPEGTAAIRLPNGEVVELGGSDTLEVEVGSEYLSGDGSVELVALDDEGTPLGVYDADSIMPPDTGSAGGVWPVLMWVLIGIAGAGAAGLAAYLLLRRRRGV